MANLLTPAEREFLLELARDSIAARASGVRAPEVTDTALTPALREKRGCFVTLTLEGALRGCIGNIHPREPLFRGVMENACGAAFRDSRFTAISVGEVNQLEIEISVLSEPARLEYHSPAELLTKLRPEVDGVLLQVEGRTATFLPQVWRKFPKPGQFMKMLTGKAGLPADAWQEPDAVVMTYQVESFESPGCGTVS